MIRWLYLFKYPEGVSKAEGERWYLGTHVPEARQMREHGLIGYRTWKALESPHDSPFRTRTQLNEWDRVTELVFADWDAFDNAVNKHGVDYTPAPYGPPNFEYYTIFISEDPEYDFMTEDPQVP